MQNLIWNSTRRLKSMIRLKSKHSLASIGVDIAEILPSSVCTETHLFLPPSPHSTQGHKYHSVDRVRTVEAAAHAQRAHLVRERVVQVVELEFVHPGPAAKDDCQDSIDPGSLAVETLREHVVPEVRMVDVREGRPAEGPSQATEEVDHEHHRPAMTVHEVPAHQVNPGPHTERYQHVE